MKPSTANVEARTTMHAIALERVDATGRIDGPLLELTMCQHYRNTTTSSLEIIQTFPLPLHATLLALDVDWGGRQRSGVVVAHAEAESRYERAIAQGDAAVMLERASDGAYTVNLGHLAPGMHATVSYRYAHLLESHQGRVRLTIPTVIAQRHGDPFGKGHLRPHDAIRADAHVRFPFTLSLLVTDPLASGQITSPSHAIAIGREAQGSRVELAQAAWLDRDVVLELDGWISSSYALAGRDGDGHVALAGLIPPVAGAPRERIALKILVDCSGSMQGESIAAARRAVRGVLSQLTAADSVSLSRFGSIVAHLSTTPRPAEPALLESLSRAIEGFEADLGGTEIASALESVLHLGGAGGPADVLLITDALSWDIDACMATAFAGSQRIFVVGVGQAPGEDLLRRLAEITGGACELLAPGEDVEVAILRTFQRVRQPRAYVTKVAWPAEPAWALPLSRTVFRGDMLHLAAGFEATAPTGEVGIRAAQSAGQLEWKLPFDPAPVSGDTLARVLAHARLRDLPPAQRRAHALRYQLVTADTSLILVYEDSGHGKPSRTPVLQRIPQMQTSMCFSVGCHLDFGSGAEPTRAPGISAHASERALPAMTSSPAPNDEHDGGHTLRQPATPTDYSITWLPAVSIAPALPWLPALPGMYLPLRTQTDAASNDNAGTQGRRTLQLSPKHLLEGIVLAYYNPPPMADRKDSQAYCADVLELMRRGFDYASMEDMLLDVAAHIRLQHGLDAACVALRTGLAIVADGSRLRSDYIVALWARVEADPTHASALLREIADVFPPIHLDALLPEAAPYPIFAYCVALCAQGRWPEAQAHLAACSGRLRNAVLIGKLQQLMERRELDVAALRLLEEELA